ncbi:hypothetical protein MBLNU230_g1646t1 [Neophaeotheca triangularis]
MARDEDSSDDEQSFKSFSDEDATPDATSQGRSEDSETIKQRDITSKTGSSRVEIPRFFPEEETSLLQSSNEQKASANALFGTGSYENAIQTYDRALASCPNYLDYELAVLRSNIAACHLKLEVWKEAIEAATKGLECLERLEPLPTPKVKGQKEGANGVLAEHEDEHNGIEEVDDEAEERIERLKKSGKTLDEVRKLQVKVLMRRAKAKMEKGGWAELQGADEDYRVLLEPSMARVLSAADRRTITESARKLAPRLNEAKDKEMAEMMGKLKGLGNSILSPFGLSTDNFQFVQDEKTGGYSMNFNQGPTKK